MMKETTPLIRREDLAAEGTHHHGVPRRRSQVREFRNLPHFEHHFLFCLQTRYQYVHRMPACLPACL